MKKKVLLILITTIAFSCASSKKEERNARNKFMVDSLMTVLKEKNSALSDFIVAFNNIENLLDSINKKHEILNTYVGTNGEPGDDICVNINNEIFSLNSLLEKKRNQIKSLNAALISKNLRNEQLSLIIYKLNEQLTQKEEENGILNSRIISLNAQVKNLRTDVDTLTQISNAQSEKILEQSAWLNTAYYITGKKNDLCDLNILEKSAHNQPKLCRNFDSENFTRIEYRELSRLPLLCKKAEIATVHPSGSYEIQSDHKKNIATLKILKPDEFWSQSKYLVIITE